MLNRLITLALAGALWFGLVSSGHAAQGSGCMPTTGTVSGLTFAQDVNAAIAALISSNSGSSAPATDCSTVPIKGQVWLDTSVTPNVLKQFDGTGNWVVIGALDATNHLWSPPVGGGTASVAAATSTDLCAASPAVQNINGTTTISGFGSSCVVGVRKTLIFNSATPLAYDPVSLILPGQSNYTTNPGDVADAIYLGAGNWRVISITKIDGSSVTNPATPLGTVLYGDYGTIPAKTVYGAGQAISRASFPAYLAAVTRAQTATLTAGNSTITAVGNTAGLGAGMPIEGTGIQSGTLINSVTSSTIVMSKTATANGPQTVTAFITGYGSGGDSTTIGVKDCRGRGMAGRDDMLGSPANRLTSSFFGSAATVINGGAGTESKSLLAANLPPYTPSGSITNGTITINATGNGSIVRAGAGGTQSGGGSFGFPDVFISASQGASTFTGNPTSGASAAFSILQPTVIAECVVVVLP